MNQAFLLIQPQTYEEVLASICYIVYWNDTALRIAGHHVEFHEDATYRQACDAIDQWPAERQVLIDISSPPQAELCLTLWRKYRGTHKIAFVGYEPYAKMHGLPYFHLRNVGADITVGAHNYLYNIDRYKHSHATLDGHIKLNDGDTRQFMPAFWGVGCPRGCEYCYISKATYPYGFIGLEQGKRLIDYMVERGWNIHFEDENFYLHPQADEFVKHLRGKNTKWICITDSVLLSKAVDRLGVDTMLESGHWLSEVGLETTDPTVLRKRQDITGLLRVQNRSSSNAQDGALNLFWLAVTLLPDETISSMNRNGRFYERHGMEHQRLVPRLSTQSSVGGCGQFFLPYPGTKFWERVQHDGKWIASPPLRLRPSWVGNALLNDVPVAARKPTDDERSQWLTLYTNDAELADRLLERCDGKRTMEQVTQLDPDSVAVFCSLSRLRCIVPVGGEQVDASESEVLA